MLSKLWRGLRPENKKGIIMACLALSVLTACASKDKVDIYSNYLDRPFCSETITENCKKESVVKTMSLPVKNLNTSSLVYINATKNDNMTVDVAKDFIEKKNTFEDLVDELIGE